MSHGPTAQIAAVGIEPTYSAREAAAMLGRSYSWLDQCLRGDKFTLPDGTKIEPRRTAGRYRRFTTAMLADIALSSYRHGWFPMEKLRSALGELAMATYGDSGTPSAVVLTTAFNRQQSQPPDLLFRLIANTA